MRFIRAVTFRGTVNLVALLISLRVAAGDADVNNVPSVTTIRNEAGDLLRKWFADGSAAGNIGDFYDNRDREHSGLNMKAFPQLQKIQYTKEQLDKRQDWAYFYGLRPQIVFGNSSTSAGAYQGGSNPRQGYSRQQGLNNLYQQYSGNNLYIYPEHRDHHPGHNGANGINGVSDGFGDLYPTNTPFLIISQGSSGSDQPFMRAVPMTLAAMRADVKKTLADKGMLMPAVQMILRYTNKQLTDPAKEYLTGKAHPPVFEGGWVQDAAMVRLAHEFTNESLPPMAKLKVIDEDKPTDGLDFFEPGATEVLATTPAVIARIFRGRQFARRIVVSAQESVDLNQRPLKYHWVVLQGDASRVSIKPRNENASEAEIEVKYQPRAPVSPGSPLESNRVDIGVFVHNGTYFSAPAFITYFFLDHEARAYSEDGRVLEIGYRTGEALLSVSNWQKMLALFENDNSSWPAQLLRAEFKPEEVLAIRAAAVEYAPFVSAMASAEENRRQAQTLFNKASTALKEEEKKASGAPSTTALEEATSERKKCEKALRETENKSDLARKNADAFLHQKREGLSEPIAPMIERVLHRWLAQPDFLCEKSIEFAEFLNSSDGKSRLGAYNAICQKLTVLRILKINGLAHELTLIRGGDLPVAERLTSYEQAMLRRCNGELLSQILFPGLVHADFRVNYVQPEISEPPEWRDVYHYSSDGTPTGWTRYGESEPVEFNAEGKVVLKRDELGRCIAAREMIYQPESLTPEQIKSRGWPLWRKTLQKPGKQISSYAYESNKDWRGKIVKIEPGE